jgi:hypothetical protein
VLGVATVAASALPAAPASAGEPTPEYEAYVNATYQGTYEEHYVDNQGDHYDFSLNFSMFSPYDLQWMSNGTLQNLSNLAPVLKEADGRMTIEVAKAGGGFFPVETCNYLPLAIVTGGRFPVLRAGPAGELDIDAFVPEGAQYLEEISAESQSYECEKDASIGTPGAPVDDPTFEAALKPIVTLNVATNPDYVQNVSAEGPLVGGTGSYKIKGSVHVESEQIPRPVKPAEKDETKTPIVSPVSPPSTPTKKKPKVEVIGAPILRVGGGGKHGLSAKLKTGVRATCPTTTTGCEVAGLLVASLPSAPGARKASGASAKQRDVAIGSTSLKLAAGASSTVTIALSRSGFALLRKDHHLPVSITVSVTAPGLASVKHSRAFTLRLPVALGASA